MITGPMLSAARTQMARMLTDTCTHYAKTEAVDASYAKTETYATIGTEYSCLIYSAQARGISSEIEDVGETSGEVAAYVIRLPWNASVGVGDKVVSAGTEFLITSSGDSDTNRFILQVGAKRIRGDKF